MVKIRDRIEDFKDDVRREAVSLEYNESKIAFIMASFIIHKLREWTAFMKSSLKTVLILSEKLHSVTSKFDRLRAIWFQDALNKAMPRSKRNRVPDSKPTSQMLSRNSEEADYVESSPQIIQQLEDDETRALQTNLLDASSTN